jgi:cytochrome P450
MIIGGRPYGSDDVMAAKAGAVTPSVPVDEDGIVLTGYDDVRAALFTRSLAQHAHKRYEKGNILEDVVMQLHLPEHKVRRRAENPLYRREAVLEYEHHRFPAVIDATLDAAISEGVRDALELAHLLTMVLSAHISGIDVEQTDLPALRRLVELERMFVQGASISDSTRDKKDVIADVNVALAAFDREFLAEARRVREQRIAEGGLTVDTAHDLLSVLLLEREALGMDDALIVREVAFFLESGSHTSSLSVAGALTELFAWRDAHPARWEEVSSDADRRRTFLQRCAHEAIRLNPVVPVLRRRATEAIRIGEHDLDVDDVVFLDCVTANRDTAVFGRDADRFDPDRQVPDGVPLFGIGFGGGMHTCIGRVLAAGVETGPSRSEPPILGQVAQILEALVVRGVRPDPDRPPVPDPTTVRRRLKELPVRFAIDAA